MLGRRPDLPFLAGMAREAPPRIPANPLPSLWPIKYAAVREPESLSPH
jgi:hypothetical protein